MYKSYNLCITYIGKEPKRPVTVKRVQPRKSVVTVINNIIVFNGKNDKKARKFKLQR